MGGHFRHSLRLLVLAVLGLTWRSVSESLAVFPKPEPLLKTELDEPQGRPISTAYEKQSGFVTNRQSYQNIWEGERNVNVPDLGLLPRPGEQDSMSQRPSASRPTSRSPTDSQIITLPPVQLRDEPQLRGGPQGLGYERQPEANFRIGTPTQHVKGSATPFTGSHSSSSSYTDERFPPSSRTLGVHTMLNPATSDGVTSSPRPSDTQSPNAPVAPGLYMIPPTSGLSQLYNNQISAGSPTSNESFNAAYARGRRILTPRSPSRIASSGHGGRIQGAVLEQKPSFIGGERTRERGAESLENRPPLHEAPSHPQHSYFPQPSSAQQGNPQSMPGARHAPSQQTPHSQSTSPSTTYSSYSQASQPSPAALYQNNPPPTSTSYFQPPNFGQSGHVGGQGGGITQVGTEGPYRHSNMSSSSITSGPSQSSSNYQLMTFPSSLGTYQISVDASSASRLADEKRARNAGASVN